MKNTILYLPHGGGPLPLLGHPSQHRLVNFLQSIDTIISKPSAIIIFSAHWESSAVSITASSSPPLVYDYYGFPSEAYDITYQAPGSPELAELIFQTLVDGEINATMDDQRGFDHGMFVPLKLMYPDADIPCVQVSLVKGLSPRLHIEIGKLLANLPQQNLLVIGSGMSFHNPHALRSPKLQDPAKGEEFAEWLYNTLISDTLPDTERLSHLANWTHAPGAQYCHPREEHLLPLHVCMGMATMLHRKAQVVFDDTLMHHRVLGFLW